jgi:hypothetical protein
MITTSQYIPGLEGGTLHRYRKGEAMEATCTCRYQAINSREYVTPDCGASTEAFGVDINSWASAASQLAPFLLLFAAKRINIEAKRKGFHS